MTNFSRYCCFFVAVAGLLLASTGFAQTKSDKPPAEGISAEIIQGRLKQVEDSHDLDESVKAKIREYYQQAMRELDSAQTWQAGATRFEQMATSAAADLAATKTELDQMPAKPSLEMPENIALPQIDQLISKKQSELDEYRARLAELEAEPNRRASRRAEIPKLAGAAKDRLAQLDEQLQAQAPADEPAALTGPRRMLLLSQRKAVECEIQAFEKEIAAYEATGELLPLRRDLSARRVALAEQEIKSLAGNGESAPPARGGKTVAAGPARRSPGASGCQAPGPRKRRLGRNPQGTGGTHCRDHPAIRKDQSAIDRVEGPV